MNEVEWQHNGQIRVEFEQNFVWLPSYLDLKLCSDGQIKALVLICDL